MEQKIFLEKNRSEFSNNVENAMNIALSTKTRLLPNDDILDNFSLFEQYNKERDACHSFRLILTVNPICSNVLFNNKTEIVINEGSENCDLLIGDKRLHKDTYAKNAINKTKYIGYMDAIRNTEYSHPENGGFVYHCGADIFNNHMLRKKGFVHVNKLGDSDDKDGAKYNTIFDYCRDGRGEIVKQEIGIKYYNTDKTKMHLYQYDTILSMPMAFVDNCIEKDGWWGFTNPSTIEIPNSDDKSISINRMMANNKSCEFIDLYPDRSLFSFVPKFNKYRRRIEKNWDYCITYPYKCDYDMINTVCGGEMGAIRANIKQSINTSGQNMVECSSYFKHNLNVGDYVTFFYYLPHYNKAGDVLSKEFVRHSIKIKVQSLGDANGDHSDRIFSVKYDDISGIYENLQNFGCFYKKNYKNNDCLYYFRVFKKLKTINGEEINSDLNKVAFAKNIYGDDIAQVVFTDDIDVNGILDNNGRSLTDVYFTIVKRNAGHKEWYEDGNFTGEAVEFSHCFGEVTSAVDFCGIENEPFDYNIHYIHNIKENNLFFTDSQKLTCSAWGETILNGAPKTLETNITIDFDEFYGDIAEYNISMAQETIIGNVYHRFNTAQREIWSEDFKDILHDEIVADDYDVVNGSVEKNVFDVETYYLNNVKNSLDTNGLGDDIMYGNISPEGYYYNPHMRIKIGEESSRASESSAKYINFTNPLLSVKKTYLLVNESEGTIKIFNSIVEANNEKQEGEVIKTQNKGYHLNITVPINYGFYKGDHIAFYNKKTMEIDWGEIMAISGLNMTIMFLPTAFSTIDEITTNHFLSTSADKVLYAFWTPNSVPTYAKLSEGTKKFVWRSVVVPSEMSQEYDLYETPFSNGRFYLENNINFFLKRQDPTGKYGLSRPLFVNYEQEIPNPMLRFSIEGHNPIDFSETMYMMNNLTTNCF